MSKHSQLKTKKKHIFLETLKPLSIRTQNLKIRNLLEHYGLGDTTRQTNKINKLPFLHRWMMLVVFESLV
jgi:hypothetical protein